jgi:hypothetical protein
MWSAQGTIIPTIEHYIGLPVLYSLDAKLYNGETLIDKKSVSVVDITKTAELISFRPQKMRIQQLSNIKLKLTDNTTYLNPSDPRLNLLIKYGVSSKKFNFMSANGLLSREGHIEIPHLYDGVDIIAIV